MHGFVKSNYDELDNKEIYLYKGNTSIKTNSVI